METSWQIYGATAPPAQTWVIVHVPGHNPPVQVALWPGHDRLFLVRDTMGKEQYLDGEVTHWLPLPAVPETTPDTS